MNFLAGSQQQFPVWPAVALELLPDGLGRPPGLLPSLSLGCFWRLLFLSQERIQGQTRHNGLAGQVEDF